MLTDIGNATDIDDATIMQSPKHTYASFLRNVPHLQTFVLFLF